MKRKAEPREQPELIGMAYDSGEDSDQLFNEESFPESEGEETDEDDVDFEEFNKELTTGMFKDIKFGVTKEIEE